MSQPLQFQGMPRLNTPVLNENGTMNVTWYRFFQSMYRRCGLGTPFQGITGYGNQNGLQNNWRAPQFSYQPENLIGPVNPRLIVFDQITGCGSPVTASKPVGYVVLTPF